MSNTGTISDEPTRLERLVSRIFRSEHNPAVVHAGPSSAAILKEGVTSQDDCAVFRFNGDQELVAGSDYIRGSKFRLYEYGLLSNYDIGYYLVAANISDVAAMGARPIGLLTVVRYPPQMSDAEFSYVLEGIRDACAEFDTPNVGGDIGSAERLILSATALGVCRPGGSLLRRGAQPGDVLCITGSTGTAGAAMQYFRSGKRSPDIDTQLRENLLDAWRRPVARVREGICLGDSGLATACQDTSDGLKATIESISTASGVGFIINEESLPVPPEVTAVCNFIGLDVLSVIMGDSVDFQLAFTVPERHLGPIQEIFADQGLDMWPIGQATATNTVVLRTASGTLVPLPGEVWRHAPEMSAADPQGPATRR